jgi:prefoldin subunit 5
VSMVTKDCPVDLGLRRYTEPKFVTWIEALAAENEQLRKDLKVSDDVLSLTARREDELEAEVEQLRQELADAHSAHATVAGLLRECMDPQPDALDSPEMQTQPF